MISCPSCGTPNDESTRFCVNCGTSLPSSSSQGSAGNLNQTQFEEPGQSAGGYVPYVPPSYSPATTGTPGGASFQEKASKKLPAGICGILVGGFGVHKFILGYTTEGIIQIAITFITCGLGGIIGLIEGIIYLTKSDEDFVRTYVDNKRGWF